MFSFQMSLGFINCTAVCGAKHEGNLAEVRPRHSLEEPPSLRLVAPEDTNLPSMAASTETAFFQKLSALTDTELSYLSHNTSRGLPEYKRDKQTSEPQECGSATKTMTATVLKDNQGTPTPAPDRKSTRLNSSHGSISYAVFCLKKKTKIR